MRESKTNRTQTSGEPEERWRRLILVPVRDRHLVQSQCTRDILTLNVCIGDRDGRRCNVNRGTREMLCLFYDVIVYIYI